MHFHDIGQWRVALDWIILCEEKEKKFVYNFFSIVRWPMNNGHLTYFNIEHIHNLTKPTVLGQRTVISQCRQL